MGDSERARLTARSASPPGVRQLVKLGIFELGQLRWRWNGSHVLLKWTEWILDGRKAPPNAVASGTTIIYIISNYDVASVTALWVGKRDKNFSF